MLDVSLVREDPIKNNTMAEFIRQLSREVNSYSFNAQEIEDAIFSDKKIEKHVKLIAAYCGIYMAYTYGVCEHFDHWDERNKASSAWCYENKDSLVSCLKALTKGADLFKADADRARRSFISDADLPEGAFLGICEWERTHHTLQQRMMQAFARILAKTKVKGFTDEKICFPFI